ncbi:Ymd8p Ecym_1405 [Eremothecium cymbalariae DBVPG|uniref:Sugar phosphate transporter domain-containing protein n=1 Tax=Eremothecium cymbalariae (strain CBS 270.75 / DBVPG 7215 / KCTC 17166 / NRRL Y-17582) TaxID=931890 RepID=G8JM63_ERECY|nr:hypothetical protein Ecym_1405 [Eremothecium cymbalariae DBVPG\
MMPLPVLVFGWYIFSITLLVYNKWMFDSHRGHSIPYPIFITSLHQVVLWFISYIYLRAKKQLNTEAPRNWRFHVKYIVPTALASAGDIGFGNASFKFIPLTIHTIVKSSSIAFVLLFGCISRLEKFHPKLALVVLFMFSGVVLMVYKPETESKEHRTDEELLGFFLVLASSCLSGLRWVYTQLTLHHASGSADISSSPTTAIHDLKKKNPVHTISQLAPIMGAVLFVTALIIEQPFSTILETSLVRWEGHGTVSAISRGIVMLVSPGIAVFAMTLCEFAILQTAPVLTLSIAGVVKELLTILISMLILKETLGFYNWIGMIVILLNVCYYNYYRYTQNSEPSKNYHPLENDLDITCELQTIDISISSESSESHLS